MANAATIELHAAGEETADGSGDAVDTDTRGLRSAVRLVLTITACVGTLTVSIESSADGSTGWRKVGSFDATRKVERQRFAFVDCDRYVRATWNLGTSATFSLSGEAHVLYGATEDLGNEINAAALGPIDERVLARCRIKASCDVEAALATGYPMPLTAWPESIGQREAAIAIFLAMKHRGFDPGNDANELIVKAHDDAQKWLKDVGCGRLKPPGLVPHDNLGVHVSSGNPRAPDRFARKMSSNWGDF